MLKQFHLKLPKQMDMDGCGYRYFASVVFSKEVRQPWEALVFDIVTILMFECTAGLHSLPSGGGKDIRMNSS